MQNIFWKVGREMFFSLSFLSIGAFPDWMSFSLLRVLKGCAACRLEEKVETTSLVLGLGVNAQSWDTGDPGGVLPWAPRNIDVVLPPTFYVGRGEREPVIIIHPEKSQGIFPKALH